MDRQAQIRRDMELDLRHALRQRRIRAALPAAGRPRRRTHHRLRGAAALAPSRARHGLAGGVHPARRGDRPDRRARRMGAAAGLRRSGDMAGRRQGRGQSVAGAVPQPQSGAGRDLGAGAVRPVAAPARAGDHRVAAARRQRGQSGARCISCASSACASRWTISAPAIRRSATCAASRSTRSRSTARSSRIWPSGRTALAIVRAIAGLGRSLGITTTAEGVETEEQLDALRAEGCHEVQGFLFSPARPAAEVAGLLVKFGRQASRAA